MLNYLLICIQGYLLFTIIVTRLFRTTQPLYFLANRNHYENKTSTDILWSSREKTKRDFRRNQDISCKCIKRLAVSANNIYASSTIAPIMFNLVSSAKTKKKQRNTVHCPSFLILFNFRFFLPCSLVLKNSPTLI